MLLQQFLVALDIIQSIWPTTELEAHFGTLNKPLECLCTFGIKFRYFEVIGFKNFYKKLLGSMLIFQLRDNSASLESGDGKTVAVAVDIKI